MTEEAGWWFNYSFQEIYDSYDALDDLSACTEGITKNDMHKASKIQRIFDDVFTPYEATDEDIANFTPVFDNWFAKYNALPADSEYRAFVEAMMAGEKFDFQMGEFFDFVRPGGIFDTFDLNHDGLIDWDEYPALCDYEVRNMGLYVNDFPEFSLDEQRVAYDATASIIGSQGIGRRGFMLSNQILASLWQVDEVVPSVDEVVIYDDPVMDTTDCTCSHGEFCDLAYDSNTSDGVQMTC